MKKWLILVLSLNYIVYSATAQSFSGTLASAKNNEILPYVNIGVIGKGTGTVSDINGKFTIVLPDSLNDQTLKFSCIGYKSRSFTVSEFKKATDPAILLEESILSLAQVIVKPKVLKTKILGNQNDSKNAVAGFKSNDLGSELGTIMKIRKSPTLIENLNFNIAKNEIQNVKFRVNVYAMKNGQPDSILLKQPIYVTTSLTSGTLTVDMKPYNLWVETDFMVSLEWIENYGKDKLYFCVGLMDSNSMWRKTSQDKWQKSSPIGIGFNSTVTYEK